MRVWWLVSLVLFTEALLTGCGTPATRVILLPDEDGHVGAVLVSNAKGQEKIDAAYAEVTIDAKQSAPSKPSAIGREAVERQYSSLLKGQPTKPMTIILSFLLDSTELTAASKAMLPEVLKAVRGRQPTEVTVFGHADASGREQHNVALSADRARVVAEILKKADPSLQVEVKYFGDKLPLVPTPPGTQEPRNRRVEIQIL